MTLPFTAGVEIESSLVTQLRNIPEGWVQATDATSGSEFKSPILTTLDELWQSQVICDEAVLKGASIHPRCGLHAHIGFKAVKDLSAKYRLFRFASRYEEHFFALCQPWQERSSYCKRITPALWEPMRTGNGFNGFKKEASNDDRYWWFNGASMHRHGTVEFRLHNGTLNCPTIVGWVSLLQCLFRRTMTEDLKVDWTQPTDLDWDQFLADAVGHHTDSLAVNARSFVRQTLAFNQ